MFRKKALITGIIITLSFTLFYFVYTNLQILQLETFELKTLDLRYMVRGIVKKDFDVVIIGVDEKSLNEIGRWPWKRSVHGNVVTKLKQAGIKSTGFDVSFTEPGPDKFLVEYKKALKDTVLQGYKSNSIEKETALELAKEIETLNLKEDYEFALALKEAGNVSVGTYAITEKDTGISQDTLDNLTYYKGRHVNIDGLENQIKEVGRTNERSFKPETTFKIIPPIKLIGEFCFGVAPYEVGKPNSDGLFRQLPMATMEEYSQLYFVTMFFLTYLNSKNYNMEKNVLLDLNTLKLSIYEDASKKTGLKLSIPLDKNGNAILNYYGPKHTFKYYSYIDVLNDKVDRKELEGKIALIGYTDSAKGLYDLRPTPFDQNAPGVEIHATAIQNIIDNNFLIRWMQKEHFFLLLIFGLFITFVLSFKKIDFKLSNIVTVFVLIAYVLLGIVLFKFNIWISMFYPMISYFFLFLTLTIINYFDEEVEKKKVKRAFQHYMSPSLIEELLKNPEKLKLGGEKKVLTALFSDIAGFTTISETMSPEQLVEFLNEYLSKMSDIIFKYDGIVDKYEGDAIMAVFGSPVYMEDHALKCCYAAIEYQKVLAEMRVKWNEEGRAPIYARIGINTGEMVAGNMGSEKKFDYTVIGDEVNLASRLEGANKEYGTYVMISQGTYSMVRDFVEVRELDIIRVKGKSRPVDVFELMARKGELTDVQKGVLEHYTKGIVFYRMQEWEKGIEAFNKALEIDENDGPSKLYLSRCQFFRDNPPGQEWDGVYTFTTK